MGVFQTLGSSSNLDALLHSQKIVMYKIPNHRKTKQLSKLDEVALTVGFYFFAKVLPISLCVVGSGILTFTIVHWIAKH